MRLDELFEEYWTEEHGERPPTKWSICSRCKGEGQLRGYPGVYTADDFASGDVDLQDYMDHRRDCEDCGGSGKVRDYTGDAAEEWREWQVYEADDRAVRRAESGYLDL